MKTTKPSNAYKNHSKRMLEYHFPRLSCAAIGAVYQATDFEFTEAFHVLSRIQAEGPDGDARSAFPGFPPELKVFLKQNRTNKGRRSYYVRDQTLRQEIDKIPELSKKENVPHIKIDNASPVDAPTAKKNEEELLECGCCYGDFKPDDMKECNANAGHKVCKECVSRYVSEQLDGNNSVVFKCIANEDCSHTYKTKLLDEVLSPRLKKRTNDRAFRENVKAAGVKGIWVCPKCAYIGYSDQHFPTMNCPECKIFYCTSCDDVAHGKMTCEEALREKRRLADPVHRAHEEMSKAVKRSCPRCCKEFLKLDGCNKMTCKCGTLSCYLCGKRIKDYSHFCNHTKPCARPDCGKTCELWTSTNAMERLDRKLRHKAGRKVLEGTGMAETDILKVLASPPKKKTKEKTAPPRVAFPNQPGPQLRQVANQPRQPPGVAAPHAAVAPLGRIPAQPAHPRVVAAAALAHQERQELVQAARVEPRAEAAGAIAPPLALDNQPRQPLGLAEPRVVVLQPGQDIPVRPRGVAAAAAIPHQERQELVQAAFARPRVALANQPGPQLAAARVAVAQRGQEIPAIGHRAEPRPQDGKVSPRVVAATIAAVAVVVGMVTRALVF